ncbi:hypothetical protein ACWEP8_04085 [Streptomyces hydrogenans]
MVAADDWNLESVANSLKSTHRVLLTDRKFVEISHGLIRAYACVMNPWEDGLFEDWPTALKPKGAFTAFSVDYRDHTLAESIVRTITSKTETIIDTNFGDVLTGADFISRIDQRDPRWEWWHWASGSDETAG